MKAKLHKPAKDFKERYDLIRHPERIRSSDIMEGIFTGLTYFQSPDPSLIAASGNSDGIECIILGQEKRRKGKNSKATGMISAGGHQFVLKVLDEAEKKHLPVISFIDTFGGDSSMKSELGGQSFLISDCISRFCRIETPTISYVIGEGGSGGALALQVADKTMMLENALYSVIAPESCSRIIFHKRLAAGEDIEDTLKDSLEVLRPGHEHLKEIGIIDEVLAEPPNGAHTDYSFTIDIIRESIEETLKDWVQTRRGGKKTVKRKIIGKLLRERREKVLSFGIFEDTMDKLARRKTKKTKHPHINKIDIEREDFHTMTLIKAHLEKEGIEETEFFKCEKEWDPEINLFRVAGGCGFVSLKAYMNNYYACPKCGKGEYLSAEEQIEKICDKNTFNEIEGDLTIRKLVNKDRYYFGKYKHSLEKLEGKSFSRESLVTGAAKVNGKNVVVAITDLGFIGGSFGAAFGEKFRRAVNYAARYNFPFVSICSSGGARMNEGPMSLAQMAKMNMSLLDLKREGIIYLSVISGPTTGGAYASYVTQGDIIIGEKGGLVEFAGPRVVTGAGFEVDRRIVITDKLYETKKIQHLVHRKDLKSILSYYVDIFYEIKFPDSRESIGRIRDFSKQPQPLSKPSF